MLQKFRNHKLSFNQTFKIMRAVLSLILICLLSGIELAACPLCTSTSTCETSVCNPLDIGIIDTAQGLVWVVCDCNTPVKIVVKKGDEEIETKTLTKHSDKWELSKDVSAGIYTIEAYHDNDDEPDQVIKKVRVPE